MKAKDVQGLLYGAAALGGNWTLEAHVGVVETQSLALAGFLGTLNTIDGDGLANVLDGTSGDDIISGFGGADTITGFDGNDLGPLLPVDDGEVAHVGADVQDLLAGQLEVGADPAGDVVQAGLVPANLSPG